MSTRSASNFGNVDLIFLKTTSQHRPVVEWIFKFRDWRHKHLSPTPKKDINSSVDARKPRLLKESWSIGADEKDVGKETVPKSMSRLVRNGSLWRSSKMGIAFSNFGPLFLCSIRRLSRRLKWERVGRSSEEEVPL